MALDPLAAAADLDRFGYDSSVVTDAYLGRASARVRGYTRQTITEVVGDQVTRTAFEPIRLPQRPVQQVTSVTFLDGDPIEEFTLVGSLLWLRDLAEFSRVFGDDQFDFPLFLGRRHCDPVTVTVTYDHGYTEVPDDLVEVVCAVAARMARTPPGVEAGVRYKQVGRVNLTFAEEGSTHHGDLLPGEKKVLDRVFPRRRAHTVAMPG